MIGPTARLAEALRRRTDIAPTIGRAAIVALYNELALAPKPGLVSFVDAGSHADMDASTFMRSLFALRRYFMAIAAAGAGRVSFAALEQLGLAAEVRMLAATGGINTHRGAVFLLGLLCAAAGAAAQPGAGGIDPAAIRRELSTNWGDALRRRSRHRAGASARHEALRDAGAEAALGYPIVFECALPALQRARVAGFDPRAARLQVLFEAMAVLDDTNLVRRGGLEGLAYAKRRAREFLDAGGAGRPDALAHARDIHAAFIARRLSPGGSADVLAAVELIDRLTRRP